MPTSNAYQRTKGQGLPEKTSESGESHLLSDCNRQVLQKPNKLFSNGREQVKSSQKKVPSLLASPHSFEPDRNINVGFNSQKSKNFASSKRLQVVE